MSTLAASRWFTGHERSHTKERTAGLHVEAVNANRWDDVTEAMGANRASVGCCGTGQAVGPVVWNYRPVRAGCTSPDAPGETSSGRRVVMRRAL